MVKFCYFINCFLQRRVLLIGLILSVSCNGFSEKVCSDYSKPDLSFCIATLNIIWITSPNGSLLSSGGIVMWWILYTPVA